MTITFVPRAIGTDCVATVADIAARKKEIARKAAEEKAAKLAEEKRIREEKIAAAKAEAERVAKELKEVRTGDNSCRALCGTSFPFSLLLP